jgi:hypothetical protein
LCNEEIRDVNSSTYTIKVNKSVKMGVAKRVAGLGQKGNGYIVWSDMTEKKRGHLEDLDLDER